MIRENGWHRSGRPWQRTGEHAARLAAHQGFTGAKPGVLQGTYTYVLQTRRRQISTSSLISASLDYPAIGRARLAADQRRGRIFRVSDAAALDAARLLARAEGIIPALESAHPSPASSNAFRNSSSNDLVILNVPAAAHKDMATYSKFLSE